MMDELLLTVVFLLLTQCCAGQSQVGGPPQSVLATLGGDIILPCHLEPSVDASGMTVEWSRPDLNPRFVYVWRDGVELESKQHPSYKGRTAVHIGNLTHGDISLKLSNVKISDEGKYRCFVPTLGTESTVELAVGVAPFIDISSERTDSSEVVLRCESKGWYSQPEVFWLDAEGNLLSAGPTETVRGPDDLYTVSSRVTVRKSDSFTCRVQQKNINKMREAQIHVPDDFSSASNHIIIIISSLVVVSIIAILAAVFAWRWKKNKIKENERKVYERTLQHKTELENQRDKLRSELDGLKREWTEKKYDRLVSRYQEGEEQDAKQLLHQKIREVEKNLTETEEEIKTAESVIERMKPVETRQLKTERDETQRSSQDESSQRKESDENTEMLPAQNAQNPTS